MRERLRVLLDVTADAVSPKTGVKHMPAHRCASDRDRRDVHCSRCASDVAGRRMPYEACASARTNFEVCQEEEVDGEGPFGLQITRDDYMHTLDTGQSRISIPPQPRSQLTPSTTIICPLV